MHSIYRQYTGHALSKPVLNVVKVHKIYKILSNATWGKYNIQIYIKEIYECKRKNKIMSKNYRDTTGIHCGDLRES